ncbi:MAG: hypothetical protein IKS14_06800 [Thermoguttaceae bacterium]|nr:hypothetical protein [Thermoguttaceae bacterium]
MSQSKRKLIKNVVCPHCWTSFPPEATLWIAEAPNLYGDRKLGDTEPLRFLPTEFDERGFAVDPSGYSCKDYACPHCHLRLPQGALEAPAIFMSIVGAPQTGKSYYLSASTFRLRTMLPRDFMIGFTDADSEMNCRIREYEAKHFFSHDSLTRLEKTQETGDPYDMVTIGGQSIVLPKPFVFSAIPAADHPNSAAAETVARTVCLYDNAGESYLPQKGADSSTFPVTRHLGQSRCIFFVFDPTQDAHFIRECRNFSNDPQLLYLDELKAMGKELKKSPQRQEAVLNEMTKRVRIHRRMKNTERYDGIFVVIVCKYDIWKPLVNVPKPNLVSKGNYKDREFNFLNMDRVKALSAAVRELLMQKTPELVAVAEGFASDVVYIPVSACGCSPFFGDGDELYFRPKEIEPVWAEIPMLYALARTAPGLIPVVQGKPDEEKPTVVANPPRKLDFTKRR